MKKIRAERLRRLTLILFLLVFQVSCSSGGQQERLQDVDSLQIYYRNFSSMSPIGYQIDDLKEYAPVKVKMTDKERIDELVAATELPCQAVMEMTPAKIDAYLLIEESKNGVVIQTWQSSPVYFSSSSDGRVCVLGDNERDRISKILDNIQHMERLPRLSQ